jgi:hypothetical protein
MSLANTKRLPLIYFLIFFLILIILSGCYVPVANSAANTPFPPAVSVLPKTSVPGNFIPRTPASKITEFTLGETSTPDSASVLVVKATSSPTNQAPTPTHLAPGEWMSLPILPSVSQTALQIYEHGLELGNDPHAFSKIGDCQSITTYFLAYFDMPGFYDLGPYASLQETIDWYSGSFSRESLAVKGGFNAAAILSPLRADPRQCRSNENPVACELHEHHPSIAIISLEEWWAGHPENYEKYMRQIIEYTISQGVVPIIATKADNLEGNNLINETIANLAQEYDIPLWNFWAAVQDLPNHGLAAYDPFGQVDLFHLTHGNNFMFTDDPNVEQSGWTRRNLTGLQALDVVRRELLEKP